MGKVKYHFSIFSFRKKYIFMNFLFNFLYLPSIVAFQPSYMLTRTSFVYIYENGIAVVVFPVPQAKILCYDFHIFCMFFFHSLFLHLKTYIHILTRISSSSSIVYLRTKCGIFFLCLFQKKKQGNHNKTILLFEFYGLKFIGI